MERGNQPWQQQETSEGSSLEAGCISLEAGCISLEAEVPEALFKAMRDFLQRHPQRDQHSVITSALASFLFQNGCSEAPVSQHYLETLFLPGGAS